MSYVSLTVDGDGVARLALDDPRRHNALSEPLVTELVAALARIHHEPDVKVVVLEGSADYFSSGADPSMLRSLAEGRVPPADLTLPHALFDLPVPVVAAMAGHAVGGGFALGLSADLVILARESRYAANFMALGFTPGMGMTRLLEHVLSPAVAAELLFTGEARRGADFDGRGAFNAVLPRGEVLPHALALAARIAEKPRPAIVALKRVLSMPRRQAFAATRTLESLMHALTFPAPEVARAIDALSVLGPAGGDDAP
jgi:polyketide biosynthesis enoyl-CoA hydratase PksI